jgi:glycosyltransferase involved in cell wall biosynthesis
MGGFFPIAAVIINYQTPDLSYQAVSSLRKFYPHVPILIIDNGSKDNSVEILKEIVTNASMNVKLVVNDKNINHGPAMNQAMSELKDEYVLFIDSDCEVLKGGFIEVMYDSITKDPNNYAVGKLIRMNKRGFDVRRNEVSIKYIRPICMLLRSVIYKQLKPFQYHGAPCLDNMIDADKHGYKLLDFNIEEYIYHKGRGTASRFGYKLGLRGRTNFLLNKLGL